MKKTLATLAAIILAATLAGGADNATSNYLGAVVYIPNTYTNAGDTGLTVSNAYLAIDAASIGITSNNFEDVRAVMYQIAQTYHAAWTTSTNRSPSVPTRTAFYAESGTSVLETVIHTLKTIRRFGEAELP
jgi:hypothetical protein